MTLPDQPRSMHDAGVRARRRTMLGLPHMVQLKTFAERLRGPGLEVPDFDPLDGGVEARALFLFEKPGRIDGGAIRLGVHQPRQLEPSERDPGVASKQTIAA